jgi:AcrR family transcriptional regulator
MDDIALELEATKGFVYYHFRNKGELLDAILSENLFVSGLEAAMVAPEGVTLTEAVRSAVRGALALMETNRELVKFIHVQALLSEKKAELVYNKILNRLYEAAAAWLDTFKRTGQVRPDVNTRALGRFLVDAISHHFIVRETFSMQREPEYLDAMLDVLRRGIATASFEQAPARKA